MSGHPRVTLIEIQSHLDALEDHFRMASTSGLVRIGADLCGITDRIGMLLAQIKDSLRSRVPMVPGQHYLKGPGASCQITVQPVQPVMRKEASVSTLRTLLGDDFNLLFDTVEVVTPRADFDEVLQQVTDPNRVATVLAAVDLTTHKPRVSFQLTEGRS